jgi:hypothetical protein
MKTIKYEDGNYEGTYDDTIKAGDIVTCYWKGYWIVESVTPRKQSEYVDNRRVEIDVLGVPSMEVRQVADASGKPKKGKKIQCNDGAYCRKAKDSIKETIKEMRAKIKSLQDFVKNENL